MDHLVSICIPCYNAGETSKETIQSLINQTYSDFEVIISDNHSTDNTIEIIKSFHDDRIRIYENESNLGVIQNYHLALSRATGKYVKLLCADDIITPDCIEKQVNVFLSHPNDNIVMVAAEKYVINKDNKILFRKPFPGKAGLYNGKKAKGNFKKRKKASPSACIRGNGKVGSQGTEEYEGDGEEAACRAGAAGQHRLFQDFI